MLFSSKNFNLLLSKCCKNINQRRYKTNNFSKLGRKRLLTGGFFMAALCLLSNMVITGNHWAISMGQFLFGKASITLTYATIYTFTPELFPTVIRNMAFGVCSMMVCSIAIINRLSIHLKLGSYRCHNCIICCHVFGNLISFNGF